MFSSVDGVVLTMPCFSLASSGSGFEAVILIDEKKQDRTKEEEKKKEWNVQMDGCVGATECSAAWYSRQTRPAKGRK
jgi:hypothetical protein